jgi:hypothetical protein
MKISAYHKARGEAVEWWDYLQSAKQNAELLLGIEPEIETTRNKKETRETDL